MPTLLKLQVLVISDIEISPILTFWKTCNRPCLYQRFQKHHYREFREIEIYHIPAVLNHYNTYCLCYHFKTSGKGHFNIIKISPILAFLKRCNRSYLYQQFQNRHYRVSNEIGNTLFQRFKKYKYRFFFLKFFLSTYNKPVIHIFQALVIS